ncbi:MAG: WecB/TagA/CpsF family glycosyltransferase [Burkholderiaceae bacterium]
MSELQTFDEQAFLDRDVVCLLGLPFDVVDLRQSVEILRRAARERRPCWLSTPNLNFLIGARSDPAFRQSVLVSDLSVADGMPIIWLARLLGLPLRERVAGSDLFEALHGEQDDQPVKAYFFGGPDGAAEAACRQVNARNSALRCVGFQSPGFGTLDSMSTDQVIGDINATGPDFVVVSLGAKKGQAWIGHNRSRLGAPLVSHLGAVVNFEAGTVRRAPPFWRRVGMEWLWRILQEPALWRRYAGDAAAVLPMLWHHVRPLAWARLSGGQGRDQGLQARLEDVGQGRQCLTLSGNCTVSHLHDLRQACQNALAGSGPLDIDMSAVTELDAHGMGMLLLAQAVWLRRDMPCQVVAASARARSRLLQHGCADLLASA